MDANEFDALMDAAAKLNFKNPANMFLLPALQDKLTKIFRAYITTLVSTEEKTGFAESMFELAGVMVMVTARESGKSVTEVLKGLESLASEGLDRLVKDS